MPKARRTEAILNPDHETSDFNSIHFNPSILECIQPHDGKNMSNIPVPHEASLQVRN